MHPKQKKNTVRVGELETFHQRKKTTRKENHEKKHHKTLEGSFFLVLLRVSFFSRFSPRLSRGILEKCFLLSVKNKAWKTWV